RMTEKELEILRIIEEDARIDYNTLAKMTNISEEEIQTILKKLEKMKVILNYSAVVDWSKVPQAEQVTAMIDVKVTPKRGVGFDEVAERIYRFSEVQA
ncbi:Lrp/AsnC family transcriptional regulator, partial [Klebsiella pneumoniae]|nr:Lrp/AsnC family transcriptional regulator [Klebsiella pneumoniae]